MPAGPCHALPTGVIVTRPVTCQVGSRWRGVTRSYNSFISELGVLAQIGQQALSSDHDSGAAKKESAAARPFRSPRVGERTRTALFAVRLLPRKRRHDAQVRRVRRDRQPVARADAPIQWHLLRGPLSVLSPAEGACNFGRGAVKNSSCERNSNPSPWRTDLWPGIRASNSIRSVGITDTRTDCPAVLKSSAASATRPASVRARRRASTAGEPHGAGAGNKTWASGVAARASPGIPSRQSKSAMGSTCGDTVVP